MAPPLHRKACTPATPLQGQCYGAAHCPCNGVVGVHAFLCRGGAMYDSPPCPFPFALWASSGSPTRTQSTRFQTQDNTTHARTQVLSMDDDMRCGALADVEAGMERVSGGTAGRTCGLMWACRRCKCGQGAEPPAPALPEVTRCMLLLLRQVMWVDKHARACARICTCTHTHARTHAHMHAHARTLTHASRARLPPPCRTPRASAWCRPS